MKSPINRTMPHDRQRHAADMRGDLLKAIQSLWLLHRTDRGFHTAVGIAVGAQMLIEASWLSGNSPCSFLVARLDRRRTRTTKLLNSNSFTGTNNRLGLPVELVKNFMIIS